MNDCEPEPLASTVLACRCLKHATIPPTIIPPETQECGLCMREEGILVGIKSVNHQWSQASEGSGDFTAYAAIQTEHGRIGILTCKRCGAAVLLDEEHATVAHLRWHLEQDAAR